MASCIFECHKARTCIVEFVKPKKALSKYLSGKPGAPAEFGKYVGYQKALGTRDSERLEKTQLERSRDFSRLDTIGMSNDIALTRLVLTLRGLFLFPLAFDYSL
jgi:hypothetical protein